MTSTTEETSPPVVETTAEAAVAADIAPRTNPSDEEQGGGGDQASLMSTPPNSPPASPKPHGTTTATTAVATTAAAAVATTPISPAMSKDNSRSGGNATSSKPRKPFLFGLLGKKKKAAAIDVLAQPSLNHGSAEQAIYKAHEEVEQEIDWFENKGGKKPKKGLFGGFRNNNNKKQAPDAPPAASWKKTDGPKEAVVAPSSPGRNNNNTSIDSAASAGSSNSQAKSSSSKKPWKQLLSKSPPPSPKRTVANKSSKKQQKGVSLDNIVVEETFVEEDPNAPAPPVSPKSGKTHQDPTAAARRKAIIQDSWDFYRLICSLVCDRDRYSETFRSVIQKDPVYPYLNSLMSVNDNGNQSEAYENFDKSLLQPDSETYQSMTKLEVAQALEKKAHESMPHFVDICKGLAGSLGVEELGIGPIKEAATALRKAQRKYDGDLLKVTDYCRALIIVDDLPALLGLLELVRDSYGEYIRRVKLSTLKENQRAKVGGYRDGIINMEINGHICELQVHLRPLWNICQTAGYKHYKHCLEYKTDSFKDAYASLKGLDRKSLRELIALADDVTHDYPLDDVQADDEKVIMDYFALSGLYYKVGSYSFASIHFSRLATMRKESLGILHPQTDFLYKYWVASLRKLKDEREANIVESQYALEKVNAQNAEKGLALEQEAEARAETPTSETPDDLLSVNSAATFWDTLSESLQQGTNSAYNLIVDPNRKVRDEEAAVKAKIRASKHVWRGIRRERYPFLEGVVEEAEQGDEEEREGVEEDNAAGAADNDNKEAVAEEKAARSVTPAASKETSSPKDTAASSLKEQQPAKIEAALVEEAPQPAAEQPKEKAAAAPVTAPVSSQTEPSEHVEEKKEDTDASTPNEKTATTETDDEAVEESSALEVFMEKACSLCAPSPAKAS